MQEQTNIDQITQEIFSVFIRHKISLDMIYFFLTRFACYYSQVLNKSLDEIKSDIEIIFKSLPPPIEDIDDNADKQSNCS
jgi:hypothetical protein